MKALIQEIVHTSISKAVLEQDMTWLPNLNDPEFAQMTAKQGVFTTLYIEINGEKKLRGCVGVPYPTEPLAHAIASSARSSAVKDPRFKAVIASELKDLIIEIEILSAVDRIEFDHPEDLFKQIDVGIHGLIIKYQRFTGLLLPKVASRNNWEVEEFIEHTCQKAGLPKKAYLNPECEVFKFSSELISL